ncbi:hypothetical protein RDV89_09390 [Nocardioides zeae]|uniref:DUF4878 domain-containing protein n=1 Tax=Nocardioides imazamoxiresistens TaxID=3231893 RepID=A0ABU3PVS0_9ACTN|nr:hypothetical protein [Nocardioides zeae]MDT9593279.1 hypothetical protein [Nocardioides zeae]
MGGARARTALAAALVAVIVVAGGATVWVLARGGDGAPAAPPAAETEVEDAVEAVLAAQSCEDELALSDGERRTTIEAAVDQDSPYCDELAEYAVESSVRDVVVEGDTATAVADVTAAYEGSEDRYVDVDRVLDLELEQRDGDWLVVRRTVYSTTPEGALQEYLSAATCEEQREVVTGFRLDKVEEALDDADSYCADSVETTYYLTVEDVTEDDDVATVEGSLEVERPGNRVPFDETTATAELTELGWILENTTSEASEAYNTVYDWHTASSCADRADLSTGAVATEVAAAEQAAAAGQPSVCTTLADAGVTVTPQTSQVVDGASSQDYEVELEDVDGEWRVAAQTEV